jgi:hypothetical protein
VPYKLDDDEHSRFTYKLDEVKQGYVPYKLDDDKHSRFTYKLDEVKQGYVPYKLSDDKHSCVPYKIVKDKHGCEPQNSKRDEWVGYEPKNEITSVATAARTVAHSSVSNNVDLNKELTSATISHERGAFASTPLLFNRQSTHSLFTTKAIQPAPYYARRCSPIKCTQSKLINLRLLKATLITSLTRNLYVLSGLGSYGPCDIIPP